MAEMELERKLKHDLSLQFESLNKKLWAKSLPSDTSVQELVMICFIYLFKISVSAFLHNFRRSFLSILIHLGCSTCWTRG